MIVVLNYTIYLEIGFHLCWHYFFNLHINYVLWTLELVVERLTKRMALLVVGKSVGWFKFLWELSVKYNYAFSVNCRIKKN